MRRGGTTMEANRHWNKTLGRTKNEADDIEKEAEEGQEGRA